ncbi:hypothetical protein NoPa_00077 [Pseudomonas phage vB_PpuM-NoPa]|uniref:Uncharacterized protein n=1 Tax=Pseudomonas phage vB_PpuM-NoPa TaxID=3132619 RepID=A0AAX4MZH8_9CAUD
MSTKLELRDKNGILRCLVGKDMTRTLIRRYLGEWKDNSKGESCYHFKEKAVYGNHDIGIAIFPGDFINVEDSYS